MNILDAIWIIPLSTLVLSIITTLTILYYMNKRGDKNDN